MERINTALSHIRSFETLPIDTNGKYWDKSLTQSDMASWFDSSGNTAVNKYAMNGLEWVPRDNFMIQAHKGEMLLTAKEADLYRRAIKDAVRYRSENLTVLILLQTLLF